MSSPCAVSAQITENDTAMKMIATISQRMRFSKNVVLFALAAGLAAWATVSRLGDVETIAEEMPAPGESELDAWFV